MGKVRLNIITVRNIFKSFYYNTKIKFSKKTLAENHFAFWSSLEHVNYSAFKKIEELMGGKPQKIIETGTSAWGTESTRFWDSYIRKHGGELWSVDIREEPSQRLRHQTSNRTHLVVDDSIEFLNSHEVQGVTLVFLDSWDVDWTNPAPSAEHGYQEFLACKKNLNPGCLILIDDTPRTLDLIPNSDKSDAKEFLLQNEVLPGKGAFVSRDIDLYGKFKKIFHEYCVVFQME